MQQVRKFLGIGVAVAVAFAGCRSASIAPAGSTRPPASGDAVSSDSTIVGTYAGTLPCADCRGIHTTLTMMAKSSLHTGDGVFALSEEYLGTPDGNRRFESRGRWTMLRGTPDDRDAIVYQLNFDGAERLMFLRRISDDAVRMLNRDQREISSNAAYTLARVVASSLGGYRSIEPDDVDARSAAEYAVSEQKSRTGTDIVLRRIVRAERQVVAGTNYRLCLEVAVASVQADVEVIVYRDLQQRASLTRWSTEGCQRNSIPKATPT